MSMLDAFFAKRFNAPKCKTLLKLTIPRIKLLRNRREIQIKQMRRDIAKLLETGQEATARIRVEHIIREENMLAAQEIIELFCELIAVRLPIIETQKECPLDLKEAISSVCFAAPRCADLQELQQVQMLFASKYGREFVSAATELMPDCGVNRQMIELLSIRAPPAETKLKLLKEIAEEHEVDWDPAASETEFFKPHEDLLNGPTQFVSASESPLPKEKYDESFHSTPVKAADEQYDSDSGLDSLDLPEVPKVSLRPSPNSSSAPEMAPPQCPTSPDSGLNHEITRSSGVSENILHEGNLDPEVFVPESEVNRRKEIQFLPFTFPSSFSSESFSVKHSEPTDSLSKTKSEVKSDPNMDLQDLLAAAKAAATKATANAAATKAAAESAERSESFSVKHSEPTASLSRTKSEVKSDLNMDLQDILAAAKAAAESAERSAAAARSAASLAEVKISELIKRRTDRASENSEHGSYTEVPDQSAPAELPRFDHQQSFGEDIGASYSLDHSLPDHGSIWKSEPQDIPSYDTPKVGFESPGRPNDQESSHHQPQRLTSLEEDPYFSYPNLFTSQSLNPTSDGEYDSIYGLRWTTSTNVYVFGITLLALISSRPAFDRGVPDSHVLYHWVNKMRMWNKCNIVAKRFRGTPGFCGKDATRIRRLALRCVRYHREKRPTMEKVVRVLEGLHITPKLVSYVKNSQ